MAGCARKVSVVAFSCLSAKGRATCAGIACKSGVIGLIAQTLDVFDANTCWSHLSAFTPFTRSHRASDNSAINDGMRIAGNSRLESGSDSSSAKLLMTYHDHRLLEITVMVTMNSPLLSSGASSLTVSHREPLLLIVIARESPYAHFWSGLPFEVTRAAMP